MARVLGRTITRLSIYRRLLDQFHAEGMEAVYSHQLASAAGVSAAQVRRDVMAVGYSGSPTHGYRTSGLAESIGQLLDAPEQECVALVGIGNLGRAILAYFSGRRPKLAINAAFDNDPAKVNRVVHGCRCYPLEDLREIVRQQCIRVAVLTVPASEAQKVADLLILSGVQGLLNFAPTRLVVSPTIFVEDLDFTASLERVCYFARRSAGNKELRK